MTDAIKNYISSLRQKPLVFRKQILVVSTFSLTALIALVWIATFSLGSGNSVSDTGEESKTSPFAIVKDNVVSIYANAIDSLDK